MFPPNPLLFTLSEHIRDFDKRNTATKNTFGIKRNGTHTQVTYLSPSSLNAKSPIIKSRKRYLGGGTNIFDVFPSLSTINSSNALSSITIELAAGACFDAAATMSP